MTRKIPNVKHTNMPLYRKSLLDFMFKVKRNHRMLMNVVEASDVNRNNARYEKKPKFYSTIDTKKHYII